jgi:hypothetical protein
VPFVSCWPIVTLTALRKNVGCWGKNGSHAANRRALGRVRSMRISSAMLVRDSGTSSANGAFGRHERQDSEGMRLVAAASW